MVQNIRYALRQLRRTPVFTLTVILTLALGIGVNAAIFSVVDTVLLRPLDFHNADRIVGVESRFVESNRSIPRIGGDDFKDLAAQSKLLEATSFYQSSQDGIQLNGHAVYTRMAYPSPLFGTVLGVIPVEGRLFSNSAEAKNEVLISAAFAEENFGSVHNALNKSVQYDGVTRTIVGILPTAFTFPNRASVWIGQDINPEVPNRTAYNQRAIARMRPGVTIEQVNAELATISAQIAAAYPEDKGKILTVVPLQEQIVGSVRPVFRAIMGAVAVILLIVCANIGHLQLVRATRRQQQVALCTALGARRSHLALQALLQAMVLAIGGAAAGLLLAIPLLRLILRFAPPGLPRLLEIRLNPEVFVFCFAVALLTMTVTAILPVWRSWHIDPSTALKQDSSRGLTGESHTLRSALIVGEIALTFVLSVASILLVQQMIGYSHASFGFDPDRLLLVDTHAPARSADERKTNSDAPVQRLNSLLDRVGHLPGIDHIAAVGSAPMVGGTSDVGYAIHGRTTFTPGAKLANANIVPITPDYFTTMQIALLSGRGIAPTDTFTNQTVVVISKSLAQQQFANQDPIGHEIMCGYDAPLRWYTIVGVVDDILQDSPASKPQPTFYVPIAQHPARAGDVAIVARTHGDPALMQQTIDKAIRDVDPSIATTASTMRQEMGASLRAQTFMTGLFGSFALLSIVLAAVGMYGVTAYTVAQRKFEFALRFAFGADRRQVFSMVIRSSAIMATIGLAIGAVLAIGATRTLASIMPGVSLTPATWVLGAVLIVLITLAATLIPARRAAATSPMEALRSE
jgi:putative ABC transport system permease protein